MCKQRVYNCANLGNLKCNKNQWYCAKYFWTILLFNTYKQLFVHYCVQYLGKYYIHCTYWIYWLIVLIQAYIAHFFTQYWNDSVCRCTRPGSREPEAQALGLDSHSLEAAAARPGRPSGRGRWCSGPLQRQTPPAGRGQADSDSASYRTLTSKRPASGATGAAPASEPRTRATGILSQMSEPTQDHCDSAVTHESWLGGRGDLWVVTG